MKTGGKTPHDAFDCKGKLKKVENSGCNKTLIFGKLLLWQK